MMLIDPFRSGGDPIQLDFLSSYERDSAGMTHHDITGVNLGAAADNRWIFLVVHTLNAGSSENNDTHWTPISYVSVAGVEAPLLIYRSAFTKSGTVGIMSAFVPTGTIGDISLSFTEPSWLAVGVYRGLIGGDGTPGVTDDESTKSSSFISLTLPQRTDEAGIFGMTHGVTEGSKTYSGTPDYVHQISADTFAVGWHGSLSEGGETESTTLGFIGHSCGVAASFR